MSPAVCVVVLHCFRHHVGCGQVLPPDITKLKTAAPDSRLSFWCWIVRFGDGGQKTTERFTGFVGVAAQFLEFILCVEIVAAHLQCVSNFGSKAKCASSLNHCRFSLTQHHIRPLARRL